MSVDRSERAIAHQEAFGVSTSTLVKGPVARNVFVIEPYEKGDNFGDKLLFGQKFRLRLNDLLFEKPMYLHSQPITPLVSAKITRRCEVVVTSEKTYDTAFQVAFKELKLRLENEGTPVPANAEVVVVHCATRQDLASYAHIQNDFGAEFEVCGQTLLTTDKIHVLHAEAKGSITGDIPLRPEQVKNHWAFLNADEEK